MAAEDARRVARQRDRNDIEEDRDRENPPLDQRSNFAAGSLPNLVGLYAGLDEFITDLEEHMRLENEVLFPQFELRGVAQV